MLGWVSDTVTVAIPPGWCIGYVIFVHTLTGIVFLFLLPNKHTALSLDPVWEHPVSNVLRNYGHRGRQGEYKQEVQGPWRSARQLQLG